MEKHQRKENKRQTDETNEKTKSNQIETIPRYQEIIQAEDELETVEAIKKEGKD